MYTFYIVNAGESAKEERVNNAIKNFGYKDQNVICISIYGRVQEIITETILRQMYKDINSTIEELGAKYINDKEKEIND